MGLYFAGFTFMAVLMSTAAQSTSLRADNLTPHKQAPLLGICNKTKERVDELKEKLDQLSRKYESLQNIIDEKMSSIERSITSSTSGPDMCSIEARGSGYDDRPRVGSVKINGRSTNHRGRGITLVTVSRGCNIGHVTRYDTYGSSTASTNLRNYLLALPANTRVVGITYDSFMRNLSPAKGVLTRYGVDFSGQGLRTTLVFTMIKGQPGNTVQRSAPRRGGPVTLNGSLPDIK